MRVKGYYTRAKVFGFLLSAVAILYLIYYFYLHYHS